MLFATTAHHQDPIWPITLNDGIEAIWRKMPDEPVAFPPEFWELFLW